MAAESVRELQPPTPIGASNTGPTRTALLVFAAFAVGLLIGLIVGYRAAGATPSPRPVNTPTPHQSGQRLAVEYEECLRIATWNIRGYPERRGADTAWLHEQLHKFDMGILCVQEIANADRLADLFDHVTVFADAAFSDSADGQDNAILVTPDVALEALEAPDGFRHPIQAAFVAHHGFDAIVVTVHLAWEPASQRLIEMHLLEPIVADMLRIDPDVMIVGDFNLEPVAADRLAERLGMSILLAANQIAVGTLHSGNSYDYFLISPDLATEEALGATVVVFEGADRAVARRVSDHMPVLGSFACNGRFRDRPTDDDSKE